MYRVKLDKKKYSEQVIRKSLYWITETSDWMLEENEDYWLVDLSEDGQQEKLARLLNDFILREQLDLKLGDIRTQLIKTAMKAILASERR